MNFRLMGRCGSLLLAAGLSTGAAHAQSPADFYKGKTVTIYVGLSAGGGYDTNARLVGRHLGKYIPGNPTVIVQNQPGAGSLSMTNQLYALGPKDGTAIGVPISTS